MDEYISREESAEILGISTRTLDRYVHKNILSSHKEGRKTVFRRIDVASLAEAPPDPKPHIVSEDPVQQAPETALVSEEHSAQMSDLIRLTHQMHTELQNKEKQVVDMSYQLGKLQEQVKHSVPLLQAQEEEQKKIYVFEEKIESLQDIASSSQKGRRVFFILFVLALGVIGVLVSFLFSLLSLPRFPNL